MSRWAIPLVLIIAATSVQGQSGSQQEQRMQQEPATQRGEDMRHEHGMRHGEGMQQGQGMRHGEGIRPGRDSRPGEGMRHEGAPVSMIRHQYVHRNGLDAQYADKRSPGQPTAEDLAGGQASFVQHCASCHGERGTGDGAAGAGLSPAPANVAFAAQRPIASDGYLFWTIAEGGVPVGSAMPPFKNVLAEDEIWQIIAYVRALEEHSGH